MNKPTLTTESLAARLKAALEAPAPDERYVAALRRLTTTNNQDAARDAGRFDAAADLLCMDGAPVCYAGNTCPRCGKARSLHTAPTLAAAQLLAHYTSCERLAVVLGMPRAKVDGKKISVALLKIERDAHAGATAHCNGERFAMNHGGEMQHFDFCAGEDAAELFDAMITNRVAKVFGAVPPGFFVNHYARGYALKINPDSEKGAELIEAAQMHTDWGRNGILSPEITGN